MAAPSSISLSQPISFLLVKPKPPILFLRNLSTRKLHHHNILHNSTHVPFSSSKLTIQNWRISATVSEASIPVDSSEQIVASTGDDGVSTIISALLFVAFLGLSILTVGVIYIAVTDFLQKREKEKFEKEEASKKKKSGRKGKMVARSRSGPKGFGQKIDEADDNDD